MCVSWTFLKRLARSHRPRATWTFLKGSPLGLFQRVVSGSRLGLFRKAHSTRLFRKARALDFSKRLTHSLARNFGLFKKANSLTRSLTASQLGLSQKAGHSRLWQKEKTWSLVGCGCGCRRVCVSLPLPVPLPSPQGRGWGAICARLRSNICSFKKRKKVWKIQTNRGR